MQIILIHLKKMENFDLSKRKSSFPHKKYIDEKWIVIIKNAAEIMIVDY